MQCEGEIRNFQAQPRAVFQRMRGKAVKGAVPTEIRVLIVRLRRDIGPRGSREPLYPLKRLQAGPPPPGPVKTPEGHPSPDTQHPPHPRPAAFPPPSFA